MKKILYILNIIRKSIIFILLILVLCYGIIVLPGLFGYKSLVVNSGSMQPQYNKYDIVYYESVKPEDVKVNNVVVFKYEKSEDISYIMHRIVKIDDNKIYTKGDANKDEDNRYINYSNLDGRIISYKIPYLGRYILYLQERMYIFYIVIGIFFLDFLIPNIVEYCRKKRGDSLEKIN